MDTTTKPESVLADGVQLIDCRITGTVKYLPPENKALPAEINACNHYLAAELQSQPKNSVILALCNIAHQTALKAFSLKSKNDKFAHAAQPQLPNGLILVDSDHCSRYNTHTKRLTEAMFHQVFDLIQ